MSTPDIGGSLPKQDLGPFPSVIPSMSSQEEATRVAVAALAKREKQMEEMRRLMEEMQRRREAQPNPNPAPTASSPRPGPAMTSQGAQAARAGALPPMAFGAADWKKYFGDVGAELPLPRNIDAILNGPCPIWPGKTIEETHVLVLVPGTVNKKSFTLDYLEQLIQRSQAGVHATKYCYYTTEAKAQHGSAPAPASHWVLMTRDVVAGTRNKSYADQQKIVARYSGYEVPGILDAATAILMWYAKTGNRLYANNPLTYTRCRDSVEYEGKKYPLAVGGFVSGSDGLGVNVDYAGHWVDNDSYGLAGLRRL